MRGAILCYSCGMFPQSPTQAASKLNPKCLRQTGVPNTVPAYSQWLGIGMAFSVPKFRPN